MPSDSDSERHKSTPCCPAAVEFAQHDDEARGSLTTARTMLRSKARFAGRRGGNMLQGLRGWTSAQKHVVAASFLGWMLDAFDFFLLAFVLADVAKEFAVPIAPKPLV